MVNARVRTSTLHQGAVCWCARELHALVVVVRFHSPCYARRIMVVRFLFEKEAWVRLPACVSLRRKASRESNPSLFLEKKAHSTLSLRSGSIALIAFAYHPSGDGETIGRRTESSCHAFSAPAKAGPKKPFGSQPSPIRLIPLQRSH